MLQVKNVNKTYNSVNGNSSIALKNISLNFDNKGLIFITGKSGSGKSTLLNILGGLEKADNGEIIIKNKSSVDFTEKDFDSYRNTYLGFIFQDFGILENLTVEENIALSLKLQGFKKVDINKKVKDILDKVGLTNLSNRAPNELSGGQLQRVSIARALIKDPDIILADEPTANLDSETGLQIINLLKSLAKEKLIIIVSHNNDYANEFADRIVSLKDGFIIENYYLKREIKEKKVIEKKSIQTTKGKKEYSNKKLNIPKTKLPFRYIVKSALNTIKKKKIKLLLTLFLFSVSLFSLSISTLFSDFNISKSTINTMNYNNVESILVKKCHNLDIDYTKIFNIDECDFKSISNDETLNIDKLVSNHNANAYKLINNGLPITLLNNSEFEDLYSPNKIYGFIEVPQDNTFNIIEGSYPTNSNEVMITDYLVKPLTEFLNIDENDLIGTNFKYDSNYLTIKGIVDTDHENYEDLRNVDYSSMSEDEIKEINNKYNEFKLNVEKIYSRFIVTKNFTDSYSETLTKINNIKLRSTDETFLGYINFIDFQNSLIDNEEIIYPNEIAELSSNEIYINLDIFIERILSLQETSTITKENTLNDLTLLDEFIGKSYIFNLEYDEVIYNEEFIIKGFIINDELKETLITSKEVLDKLSNVTYDGYNLILANKNKDNVSLVNELNDNNFVQITPYSNQLYLFNGITQDLNNTLYGVTIILTIFASVLIYVTMSNSINDKQKDIGILRAIGTRGKDVGYIFLIESLILALTSVLIAIFLSFIVTYILNISLMNYYNNNILFFSFGLKQVIYIILFSLIITLISTIVPIIRLVKMKPIDVVRKK